MGAKGGVDLLGGFNIVATVVPCRFNIGDDADLAAVVDEAFTEDGIAAILEHSRFDRSIYQNAVGRIPLGTIAFINLSGIKIQAITAG